MGQQFKVGDRGFKPSRREVARVRNYARQCEANAYAAVEFASCNFAGAADTCARIAQDYSRKAFYLSRQVAEASP